MLGDATALMSPTANASVRMERHTPRRITIDSVHRPTALMRGANGRCVLIGTSAGLLISQSTAAASLVSSHKTDFVDTKAGSISCIVPYSIPHTEQHSDWSDVAVGHSSGLVTMFSNGQRVASHQLGTVCIASMVVALDSLGSYLVAADKKGTVAAFRVHELLWRFRLSDLCKGSFTGSRGVSSMLHTTVLDQQRNPCPVLIICDTQSEMHFFHRDTIIHTIRCPSQITIMAGYREGQILCGTADGFLYYLSFDHTNPELCSFTKIFDVEYPLTGILSAKIDGRDCVILWGHFDHAVMWDGQKLVKASRLSDWIQSIAHISKTIFYVLTIDGVICEMEWNPS
eukprot:TRINITY_DN6353_c0_g1_i3.p1 TRINITY_DN6353_c0_g1~~TRINITY_DN6353_c0_g1_i3.p1  ORF type:complete len:342 (+),score=43.21 TRINITY_DN6353_c0_g1_i3:72-1097(+)